MSEFCFVIQVPALSSQTEETSDRARKLEIKEFSNANFVPFVCENKDECSSDFQEEDKDGKPEENSTTESIIELEEMNSAESEDTGVTILMEEYARADLTTPAPLLSGGEEIRTTTETPHTSQYQDSGDGSEAMTESPDMEMTTEFVEAQIPTMKKLGEELLPYVGVIYYHEENEVEQTTAIFIPNGDKELLEVLPTKEPNASDSKFQSTLSLETPTDVTENPDYQEEETTVSPDTPDLEMTSEFDLFNFLQHGYLWS